MTKKISFEVSPEVNIILERVAKILNISEADVLKKGIQLVDLAIAEKRKKK